MLKSFTEMQNIDIKDYCEKRKSKDENNGTIEIAYLPWARCVDLLHQNGAETVYFSGVKNEQGSYLFENKTVTNKSNRTTGCYFVSTDIFIDDKTYRADLPLLSGNIVIYDDTLNQLRIATAHARAFVKGVAIHTGLGFNLWTNYQDESAIFDDDLSIHDIYSIKKRIEEKITSAIKKGTDIKSFYSALNITEKQYKAIMGCFDTINRFEKAVDKI